MASKIDVTKIGWNAIGDTLVFPVRSLFCIARDEITALQNTSGGGTRRVTQVMTATPGDSITQTTFPVAHDPAKIDVYKFDGGAGMQWILMPSATEVTTAVGSYDSQADCWLTDGGNTITIYLVNPGSNYIFGYRFITWS